MSFGDGEKDMVKKKICVIRILIVSLYTYKHKKFIKALQIMFRLDLILQIMN